MIGAFARILSSCTPSKNESPSHEDPSPLFVQKVHVEGGEFLLLPILDSIRERLRKGRSPPKG